MGTHHTADQGHKTPRALRAKSADVVGAQRAQGSPWSGYAWWVLQDLARVRELTSGPWAQGAPQGEPEGVLENAGAGGQGPGGHLHAVH